MKATLTFLTVLLLGMTGNAQTLDCEKFKTGTFYYPQIPGRGNTVREKKTQTSYYEDSSTVSWNVKWTDKCSFELTFKSSTGRPTMFKKGDKLCVTIIAVDGDCYTFDVALYNDQYPKGMKVPPGQMCLKKD